VSQSSGYANLDNHARRTEQHQFTNLPWNLFLHRPLLFPLLRCIAIALLLLARICPQLVCVHKRVVWQYDRSGRSTGTAYITYNSASEAARAKEQLDGLTAKGEQMNIAYDTRPPPGGRRTGKLIDRIGDDFENSGPGPVRTRGGGRGGRARGRGGPREEREGRGGGGGGGSRRASARDVPTSKSLADLDKELEAFMGDGTKDSSTTASQAAPAAASAGSATEDVAMT